MEKKKVLGNLNSGEPTSNSAHAVYLVDIEMLLEWNKLRFYASLCDCLYEILLGEKKKKQNHQTPLPNVTPVHLFLPMSPVPML